MEVPPSRPLATLRSQPTRGSKIPHRKRRDEVGLLLILQSLIGQKDDDLKEEEEGEEDEDEEEFENQHVINPS